MDELREEDVMRIAIASMQKQIPQEPKERDTLRGLTPFCPVCDFPVTVNIFVPRYCKMCGQALDMRGWTE